MKILFNWAQICILSFLPLFASGQVTEVKSDLLLKGWKNYDPGARVVTTLTSDFDVRYHRINISANPGIRYLRGSVTTYFTPKVSDFHTIHLNLRNNMTVDSVRYGGNKISTFAFISPHVLQIVLPATIQAGVLDSLSIFYQGAPINDGFGSFGLGITNCGGPNDKVMWTLSEPYGAKNWWPCKETLDDKADSLDMIVTCPSPYRVASNGLLVDSLNMTDSIKYHWSHRYPIPAYLVAFAIADYKSYSDFVSDDGSSPIEVLNYVYPCNNMTPSQTPNMTPMFQYFIDKFGEYPFRKEKYGHAQCGFGGGMEHSTMSFMGGFSRLLLAHELAHQWFGNKITCGSWQDIWLNEGFATYLEGLTCEKGWGDQTWATWKTSKITSVTSNNFGSTYVTDTVNVGNIFNGRLVYNKGAMILHMLRWKLGDSIFFKGIYDYINHPALTYGFARTNDLKAVLMQTSGQDLTEFFNDWLYGQGWPNYNITWSKDVSCNKVYVNINQTHSASQGTFFEMPVPIVFSDGVQRDTLVFDQSSPGRTSFDVKLGFTPNSAVFDPEKWLCAKATITEVPFNGSKHIIWIGSKNDDWHDSENWDCGIPTPIDDVTIPYQSNPCTVRTNTIANCRKLTIENSSLFKTESGSVLNIHH